MRFYQKPNRWKALKNNSNLKSLILWSPFSEKYHKHYSKCPPISSNTFVHQQNDALTIQNTMYNGDNGFWSSRLTSCKFIDCCSSDSSAFNTLASRRGNWLAHVSGATWPLFHKLCWKDASSITDSTWPPFSVEFVDIENYIPNFKGQFIPLSWKKEVI